MSEFENNDSIVPVPNENEQQTPSTANNEITKSEPTIQKQYIQKVVEKYEKKTAGFWFRFCAYAIDWLVVGAIVGILVNPIFYLMDWSFDDSKWYAPMAIISAIFYYGYFIITTKIWQQTLGKMVFGLKVVPLKEEKLTWGTVIFRELIGRFIDDTLKLSYIIVAFMPKNQSIHDIITDTVVLHEKIYVKNKETIVVEQKLDNNFDSDGTQPQTV